MISLTDEENESYLKQEVCHICKNRFITDDDNGIVFNKVRYHCHYAGKYRVAHFFIMKIPNKREHQDISFNHSSDIDFQDFMKNYNYVLQNHILFYSMIQPYHQIIL